MRYKISVKFFFKGNKEKIVTGIATVTPQECSDLCGYHSAIQAKLATAYPDYCTVLLSATEIKEV